MALSIITADQRMSQKRGVKALIVGEAGVGKTTLLRTLDLSSTLFLDLEAGDLAVQDLHVDTFRPQTWDDCRDLAVFLAGPNKSLPATACYSQAHYDAVVEQLGDPAKLDKYATYFIDSITVAGRLCFRWCEQQPESTNDRGKKDVRGTYGLHGREMINWLTTLQHARAKNVIFVGILQKSTDDFNVTSWDIQIDGSKTGRELPGIVDQIITLAWVKGEGWGPSRAFVCTQPNAYGFPAKDRAGRLEELEEPDLGRLLTKLTTQGERRPVDHRLSMTTEKSTEAAA